MKAADIYTTTPWYTDPDTGVFSYMVISQTGIAVINTSCANGSFELHPYVSFTCMHNEVKKGTQIENYYADLQVSRAEVVHNYVTKPWKEFTAYIFDLVMKHNRRKFGLIGQIEMAYEDYHTESFED